MLSQKRPFPPDTLAQDWIATSQQKWVICADIDDTLISRVPTARNRRAVAAIRKWTIQEHIPLVLISGLEVRAIRQRITRHEIPMPEIIVGAVGTDIWLRTARGEWRQDSVYREHVVSTGYTPAAVHDTMTRFMADLEPVYGMRFQDIPATDYKVSTHFMATHTQAAAMARRAQAFFPAYKILVCEEIHHNARLPAGSATKKFCLDVVPVTKADAIGYIAGALGTAGGIKAGDSGNDVDMLLAYDSLTPVLVGGYKPEAYTALAAHIPVLTKDTPLHTLDDGRTIYIENDHTRTAAASLWQAIQFFAE